MQPEVAVLVNVCCSEGEFWQYPLSGESCLRMGLEVLEEVEDMGSHRVEMEGSDTCGWWSYMED